MEHKARIRTPAVPLGISLLLRSMVSPICESCWEDPEAVNRVKYGKPRMQPTCGNESMYEKYVEQCLERICALIITSMRRLWDLLTDYILNNCLAFCPLLTFWDLTVLSVKLWGWAMHYSLWFQELLFLWAGSFSLYRQLIRRNLVFGSAIDLSLLVNCLPSCFCFW